MSSVEAAGEPRSILGLFMGAGVVSARRYYLGLLMPN